jgi:DNA adenine methylase
MREIDGFISTPLGAHSPIPPSSFHHRVNIWNERLRNVEFVCSDYRNIFSLAKRGDLIYCDPPYSNSQSILYGAQGFILEELLEEIKKYKQVGVKVALSINGPSSQQNPILQKYLKSDLFVQSILINTGKPMLTRLQTNGKKLKAEDNSDRLLLTYN